MSVSSPTPHEDLYQLIDARHGRFLVNPRDTYIGRGMIDFGEFSEIEVDLLRQITRPGSHIAEIGANIGTHTVPLAQHVGPSGFVHAVEMQPLVFQLLCANLALNDIANVNARNLACGAEEGVIPFPEINYAVKGNFGGVGLDRLSDDYSRRSVEVRPFDSFDCRKLDLLKIDVEGAELDVLKGAEETIKALRPLLYVENDRHDKSSALIRHIQDLDYRLWWHLPPLFNPQNWSENTDNPWPGIVSCNMLCIPSEKPADISGLREVVDPDAHPLKR